MKQALGRFPYWLQLPVLLFCALSIYLFLAFSAAAAGSKFSADSRENLLLDFAVAIAPWSPDVLVDKAEYLRAYAVTQPPAVREEVMSDVLNLMESAIRYRPLWPYYHLGALDAEYLSNQGEDVIQSRLDTLMTLAPNERGIDRNLIELSLLVWPMMRTDQRQWVGQRVLSASKPTRKYAQTLIEQLVPERPSLCGQLPWSLVKSACRN